LLLIVLEGAIFTHLLYSKDIMLYMSGHPGEVRKIGGPLLG
jgi:hypothetical protein